MRSATIHVGDSLDVLRTMADESVQCVVTSPPYWGLRDYGVDGQIGLEETFPEFLARLVEVFREVRRVLRADGVCWVNMGDGYAQGRRGPDGRTGSTLVGSTEHQEQTRGRCNFTRVPLGLKPKDLIGQPWRLAFALQDDGWYLRSDCIWSKPNPMPESVTDRPTKAHEYVFLLTKAARYFYDADGVRQPHAPKSLTHRGGGKMAGKNGQQDAIGKVASGNWAGDDSARVIDPRGANLRTVWTIPTQPFADAHFATFPLELPARCIRAGTKVGDVVLDPFSGAGTTGLAALRLGRRYVGIELNPEYAEMSRRRLAKDQPLFSKVEVQP